MDIKTLLLEGQKELTGTETETPHLDASLLLCHILQWTKEKLYLRSDESASEFQQKEFRILLEKRKKGYPVAYLTGGREFFGRMFSVREGVLCPRPDTEILLEEALSLIGEGDVRRVLDIGTGTGALSVSLAAELPQLEVSACDISPAAEEVFRINNDNLCEGRVRFFRSDLLEDVTGRFDMIVSNPPYLTTPETRERMDSGWKEPALALDGGSDGLVFLRKIITLSKGSLQGPGWLLMEADPAQMDTLEKLMRSEGYAAIARVEDLAGHQRVIRGCYQPTLR